MSAPFNRVAPLPRAMQVMPFVLGLLWAVALRLLSARGDLGLDEVWSLGIASRLSSALEVYAVKHDNNHLLNTLWLVWLGQGRSELLYRLPSVVAGIVTVVVAVSLVPRTNRAGRVATLWLFASSMLLVTYSSEARGYALAVCFALLSLLVLERILDGSMKLWGAPLFWVLTALSVISHLSALTACVAIAFYGLLVRAQQQKWRALLGEGVVLHAVPAFILIAHYLLFVRSMKIGGGAEASSSQTIAAAASLALGAPVTGPSLVLSASIAAVVGSLALYGLLRARDPHLALYGAGLVLPLLALEAMQIKHAAPRYLLVSVIFFLLLFGRAVGAWIERGGTPRTAAIALLVCVVLLNTLGDIELIRLGRGSYRRAVAFMLEHSQEGPVTVTSDHDFRSQVLLAHYARLHPQGRRIAYLSNRALPAGSAEWLVLHRVAGDFEVPPSPVFLQSLRYEQQLALPCASISGLSWYLYKRR